MRKKNRSLTNSAAWELQQKKTPAPSNLNAKHDEPTAAPGRKLWVCPNFGTFSDTQSCPSGAVTVSAWHASCSEGRHQCRVNGKLHTAPQRQAIRDDFYASLVLADRDNIEITHKGMHRDSSARLPAYPWPPPRASATHQTVGKRQSDLRRHHAVGDTGIWLQ